MNVLLQFGGFSVRAALAVIFVAALTSTGTRAQAQRLLASTSPDRAVVVTAVSSPEQMQPAASVVGESESSSSPANSPTVVTPLFQMTSALAASDEAESPVSASLMPSTPAPLVASPQQPLLLPPHLRGRYLGRVEVSQWGSAVSNGFGNWYGGGLHLFLDPAPRFSLLGEVFYQHRPNETEVAGTLGATIHLTHWFYTNLSITGGGPDDSAAFLPRLRYDINGTLATPIPGFNITGGWTRLAYGNPVSGRIIHAGLLQYAGKVILQGTVNFNNVRPGNHKSVDGLAAIQYGEEGRYWIGASAGGGTEAWQTLGLFPSSVQFDGYSLSAFARKWITPSTGVVFRYNYYVKHAAYHFNGGEFRFFWQF